MENIQKIKYSISCVDIDKMKFGIRYIIELSSDGCLSIKEYLSGTRKIKKNEKYYVEPEEIKQLYNSIRQCIEEATAYISYIDDKDAKLSIYYPFGRVETMPRGLGNDDHTVGSIFMEFVSRYHDIWEY